jgi:hypothetical protein
MDGKLTLRSPLGEGTSLVIELPLEPAGELDGCGCASSPVPLDGGYPPGRFLIRLSVNALRRLAAR